MTIARDITPTSGGRADGSRLGGKAFRAQVDGSLIPTEIRRERLDAQVRSFERAGYRLETRADLQAIVFKPRGRRPARSIAVAIATLGLSRVLSLLGARSDYHRVVITVDQGGAVRLA